MGGGWGEKKGHETVAAYSKCISSSLLCTERGERCVQAGGRWWWVRKVGGGG